jgi:AAA domain
VIGWQAKKPEGYRVVPYIGSIDPFDRELADDWIYWPEGEKDCDTLGNINFPAFTFGGCSDLPQDASNYLNARLIVILADNDSPGRAHADKKAELANRAGAQSVKVLHFPDLPEHGDVSDFLASGGTREELMERVEAAPEWHPVNTHTPRATHGTHGLIVRRASDIVPEKVEPLWPGRLWRGKHTCFAGEPGTGKSQLLLFIAAAVTTGREWPCGEGKAPIGSVIILSAEDGEADTIVPRLIAAGADRKRISTVAAVQSEDGKGRRAFNLQADLQLLEDEITRSGDVALVIIDPVSSYLGKADSHKNSEVRGVLEPISEMAARTRVAIASVTHFSKYNAATTTKALHRFIGSIAFVGAPRAAFAVIEDPEDKDRRLLLHAKNNLAAPPKGLAFRLEQRSVAEGVIGSSIYFEHEHVSATADETLATDRDSEGRSAKEDAIEFLQAMLADKPVTVEIIEQEAKAAGLLGKDQSIGQSKPFRSARKALGIKPYQPRGTKAGGWVWALSGAKSSPSDALQGIRCPSKNRSSDAERAPDTPAPSPVDAQNVHTCPTPGMGKDGYGGQVCGSTEEQERQFNGRLAPALGPPRDSVADF